ncbi:MAG TPA: GNAT family N-acetyltransferase [Thermoanaerobaculia bacterium]|nr:GNAT family N-acetyltransferase [Thermoanaerobaculia bacterium]
MPKIAEIETERLLLCPLRASDRNDLHHLFVDPDVRRYLWDDEVLPIEQTWAVVTESLRRFAADGTGLWAVTRPGRPPLAGFGGYWPFPAGLEILFGLAPVHWGRGLATELARTLLRYGFEELGLDRVDGSADAPNAAALRVMEKAGMREVEKSATGGRETLRYSLSRDEFQPGKERYLIHRA